MKKLRSFFRDLFVRTDGASASEYGVLVAIIIVAIAAAVVQFDLGNSFGFAGAKVQSCVNNGDGTC